MESKLAIISPLYVKWAPKSRAKINRKDLGLLWDAVTEAGCMVISDDVSLHTNVQLVKNS